MLATVLTHPCMDKCPGSQSSWTLGTQSQDHECSEGFLSPTVAFFKTLLMLSYVLISFHFKCLFTPLGLTTPQDKRYHLSQMVQAAPHGCGLAWSTYPKCSTFFDHAAKAARVKIPHPQSTCKMERKHILSIALWHNYLQYRHTVYEVSYGG